MNELLSVGYAAIDRIDGNEYFGGAAAGIAINGKRLGLDTGLLALFGKDEVSLAYMEYLAKLGVDLVQSQTFSGVTIPVNEITQTNQIGGWKDNGIAGVSPQTVIREEDLRAYNIVHLASPHFSLAEKVSRKRDGILTYTPGPKLLHQPEYLNFDALRRSQIVFFNEGEWNTAKKILNVDSPGGIIDYGPSIVVTTLGTQGSTVSYRDKTSLIEDYVPTTIQETAETTGAGDAFSLGFIIGYINKLPLKVCAEIGTTMSSHAIKINGVIISDQDLAAISHKVNSYGIRL